MPNMDKTGPQGQGSRTGRQMGNCAGTTVGTTGRFPRRGFGRGFGGGFRRFSEPTEINLNKEEQIKVLEAEKVEIEKRLKQLKD